VNCNASAFIRKNASLTASAHMAYSAVVKKAVAHPQAQAASEGDFSDEELLGDVTFHCITRHGQRACARLLHLWLVRDGLDLISGECVLRELSRRAGVSFAGMDGFVAGGAVAAVVLGWLDGVEYPIADVDVFTTRLATFRVAQRATQARLVTAMPSLDWGSFLIPKLSGGYSVVSSRSSGVVNTVLLRTDIVAFSLENLLSGFDLNCTQVGVALSSGDLRFSAAFRNFAESRVLRIDQWATPPHSLIRYIEKLGIYGSTGDVSAQVTAYTQRFVAHLPQWDGERSGSADEWTSAPSRWWFGDVTLRRWRALAGPTALDAMRLVSRELRIDGEFGGGERVVLYALDPVTRNGLGSFAGEGCVPMSPDFSRGWWAKADRAALDGGGNGVIPSVAIARIAPDFLDRHDVVPEVIGDAFSRCSDFILSTLSFGCKASDFHRLGASLILATDPNQMALLQAASKVVLRHPEGASAVRRFLSDMDWTRLQEEMSALCCDRPRIAPLSLKAPDGVRIRELVCERDFFQAEAGMDETLSPTCFCAGWQQTCPTPIRVFVISSGNESAYFSAEKSERGRVSALPPVPRSDASAALQAVATIITIQGRERSRRRLRRREGLRRARERQDDSVPPF
jgi:hypothetical protein